MKKTTLMILAVSAILGAMMVGCSKAEEGNTDPGATSTSTGASKDKPMAGGPAATSDTTTKASADNMPAGNAPASTAPAPDKK